MKQSATDLTLASSLRRLDLNLLPLFAALMRERSVTRAGQALFLSQPAASAGLSRLRAAFQDELFIRHGNTLEPTSRAEQLMLDVAPAMRSLSGALAAATPFDPQTDSRTFHLGLGQDVTLAAYPLIRRFRDEAPNCRLVLHTTNHSSVASMLDARTIGAAVGFFGDDLPADTKRRVLLRGGFKVLRDRRSPGPVDLDMFCARPHVLVTARGDLVGFVDELLAPLGRSRDVVIGVPDFAMLTELVGGTDLVCTVADAVLALLRLRDPLAELAADEPPFPCPDSTVHLVWQATLDHDPGEIWLRSLVYRSLHEEAARPREPATAEAA